MIIALAGRMSSGKSELANVCINNGFEIIKFADGLKDLICELIGIDRCFLENNKDVLSKYTISYELLSLRLDILESDILSTRESSIFNSIRELMQFIGTDLIRKFKPSWHIDQLKARIIEGTNYCIDDLRFKDEKAYVDSVSGDCWYVLRPGNFNISNHDSEVSLSWFNFDTKTIMNDGKLSSLVSRWEKYLCIKEKLKFNILGCSTKSDLREYLYKSIHIQGLTTNNISDTHGCSRDKIVWWCSRLLVPIKRVKYPTNNDSFLLPTKEASYYAGLLVADGCIKRSGNSATRYVVDFGSTDRSLVEGFKVYLGSRKPIYTKLSSGYKPGTLFNYFICDNPYVIHNLKYWDLQPRKSTKEKIPSIIRNEVECLKQWTVGLIDGDGSIYTSGKTLGIMILSSKEVVDFIYDFIPIKGIKNKHKDTDLYELRWYNFKAVDVFEWLSPEIYLNRKWDKIKDFLEFNTKRKTLKK
jgi:hypothetical protein